METSRDPNWVFISRVSMPLFIPTAFFHGGRRLSGIHGQYIAGEEIPDVIRPIVESTFDETDELIDMVRTGTSSKNTLLREVAGYAELLLGNSDSAKEILASISAGPTDDSRAFVLRMGERVNLIKEVLRQVGPSAAIAQLDNWVSESVRGLGLIRYQTPTG